MYVEPSVVELEYFPKLIAAMSCPSCSSLSHRIEEYEAERSEIIEESEAIYESYCKHKSFLAKLKKKYSALKKQWKSLNLMASTDKASCASTADLNLVRSSMGQQTELWTSNKLTQIQPEAATSSAQTETASEHKAVSTEVSYAINCTQTEDEGGGQEDTLKKIYLQIEEMEQLRFDLLSKIQDIKNSAITLQSEWADLRLAVTSEIDDFAGQFQLLIGNASEIVNHSQADLSFSDDSQLSQKLSGGHASDDDSYTIYSSLKTQHCSPRNGVLRSNSDTFAIRTSEPKGKEAIKEDSRIEEDVDSILVEYDELVKIVTKQSKLLAQNEILIQKLEEEIVVLSSSPKKQICCEESQTEECNPAPEVISGKADLDKLVLETALASSQEQILRFKERAEDLVYEIAEIKKQRELEFMQKSELVAQKSKHKKSQCEMLTDLFAQNKSLVEALIHTEMARKEHEHAVKDLQGQLEALKSKQEKLKIVNKVLSLDKDQLMKEVLRLQGCCYELQTEKGQHTGKIAELEAAIAAKETEFREEKNEIPEIETGMSSPKLHFSRESFVEHDANQGSNMIMLELIKHQTTTLRSQLEFVQELLRAKEEKSKSEDQDQDQDQSIEVSGFRSERLRRLTVPARMKPEMCEVSCLAMDTTIEEKLKEAEQSVEELTSSNTELLDRLQQLTGSELESQSDLCSASDALAEENKTLKDRVVALKRLYSKELMKSKLFKKDELLRKYSEETSDSFDLMENLG